MHPWPNPHLVLWVLIALGVLWTAAWAFAVTRAPGVDFEALEPGENRLRRRLFVLFGLTLVVIFIVTFSRYPYPSFRTRRLGPPQDSVAVMAEQWGWGMSHDTVPAHVPVAFVVQSRDVNHGFGIYRPDGVLVAQVQAMPGYTNRLIYRFEMSGTYTVRCLEYCGIFHHIMVTTLTVR